jgi:hypothetical protein
MLEAQVKNQTAMIEATNKEIKERVAYLDFMKQYVVYFDSNGTVTRPALPQPQPPVTTALTKYNNPTSKTEAAAWVVELQNSIDGLNYESQLRMVQLQSSIEKYNAAVSILNSYTQPATNSILGIIR